MSKRTYRSIWEHDPNLKGWILPDENDEMRAFCKLCKCSLLAHKKDLLLHSKSKKHQQFEKRYTGNTGSSKSMANFLDNDLSKKRKTAELKIAVFIAEHCSIRTADHLTGLITGLDDKSELISSIKIHRTKCTALLFNVVAPCLLEDLINDIGNTKYSLIVDESTAIDTKKMLCIMIKYFSHQQEKIITTFYKLIEIDAGDAATLSKAVLSQLNKDKLDTKNLIGIGVDGANVMVGENHSFSTFLTEAANPELVVIKCICHSLHLAAEYAFKILPKHLDFIIKETHNWFSISSKRQIAYKELFKTMNEGCPTKIDKLSGTRWLARYNAINKIVDQWPVLKLHFQLTKDKERSYIADQLFQMYNDKSNYLYLVFLQKVLKDVITLNTAFQSDTASPLKLLDDLLQTFKNYLKFIIPPIRLEEFIGKNLTSFPIKEYIMDAQLCNFGYSFLEAESNFVNNDTSIIRSRCRDFIVELCIQIQTRLPKNISMLQDIKYFTPENALSKIRRPNITSIARRFALICQDIDATISEWDCLNLVEWENVQDVENFWVEVSKYKNSLDEYKFQHISTLAISLLSLPFSNASVERAFSMVNIVKNKLRNRLAIESTDNLLRVRFYLLFNKGCVNFCPSKNMLKKFNNSMYKAEIDEEAVLELFQLFE